MKKLEELGISPWPWDLIFRDESYLCTYLTRMYVNDKNKTEVCEPHRDANARLIAAAPDLYECLREAVEEMCHMTCEDSMDKCTHPESVCFVAKWRKALAKASGESELK